MSDEYIKKKDAMDKVRNNLSRFVIAIKIGDISPEDVEPVRHGRWDADMGGVWCSVCGEYSEGEWDYCPYCGARMDGESDE